MLRSTYADSNDMLTSLLATATVALDTDCRAAKHCIQRAAALLGIDLGLGGDEPAQRSYQVGLALWQAKLLRTYIEDKLDSSIRTAELACMVRLSTSHFFRAFRRTFGESPRAYIMQRRIRRAQELMLTSRLPLSQVALECGMCDQPHFCRVFRRVVGINPNAWRRQSPGGSAPDSSVEPANPGSDGVMSPAAGSQDFSRALPSERRAIGSAQIAKREHITHAGVQARTTIGY